VPGYWFTVALIDVLGRFKIQMMGFAMMTVFMLGLAIPYHHWTTPGNHIGFLVMYAFTFFFANFGPNSTTFIVPAEIFPARLRSTCHGISAAAGKAGAIIGSFGFLYAAQSTDPNKTDAGWSLHVCKAKSTLPLLPFCERFVVYRYHNMELGKRSWVVYRITAALDHSSKHIHIFILHK